VSSPSKQRFSRDVAWNMGSFAVAGVCGIALNALVVLVYNDAALGVFNQVFAAYILFSQIAALGIHYSALQRIAASTDADEQAAVAWSALVLTAGIGLGTGILFWVAAPLVGDLVKSDDVATGMRWAAPGVAFFALDKVALGCVNGLGRMRAYALLFGGRAVLLVAAFGACVAVGAGTRALPVVFTISEAVTLIGALVAIADLLRRPAFTDLRRRVRDHLDYGLRGFLSGVLADLNTRIDVLMLGYFVSDAVVGVFSFGAILAEGIFQLLTVLRTVYAPVCTRLWASGERDELTALIRRGRNRTYLVAVPAAALAIAGYWVAGEVLEGKPVIAESWPYFAVLLIGMAAVSGYVPFGQILLQTRMPGWHTWQTLAVLAINIVANAALIQLLGPIGAPIGTGIAFVALAILISTMSRRLLGLRI
jgi:O-antigen/teichoic acid export membrane protein